MFYIYFICPYLRFIFNFNCVQLL
uniref:Uncharacterized protein n=1 Tax=Heterorhabditis bacteriophora TaxID=37862 RepID=A0A1I7X3Y9_HETBA